MNNIDIIFIGVNYLSSNETIEWVKSIIKTCSKINHQIIVVDNSAEKTDNTLKDHLHQLDRNLVYVNDNDNLGYFPGANKGITYANRNGISAKYIVVSNVDLRFRNMDFLENYNFSEGLGVIAPRIVELDKDRNPYKISRPTLKQLKRRLLFFKVAHLKLFTSILMLYRKTLKNTIIEDNVSSMSEIYAAYGACFIFTSEFFKMGGTIDYPFFLYGEEMYIAEQCRTKSLKTLYIPEIQIENVGHVSTGLIQDKKKNKYLAETLRYIIQKFY